MQNSTTSTYIITDQASAAVADISRSRRLGDLVKRAFDLLVSFLGLLFLSLVFLYIAYRIKA